MVYTPLFFSALLVVFFLYCERLDGCLLMCGLCELLFDGIVLIVLLFIVLVTVIVFGL